MKKLVLPILAIAAVPALAQTPTALQTVWSGVYSSAQAARGQASYSTHCSGCHGDDLSGIDVAPSLAGGRFTGAWSGQTVADLATRIRTTMPQQAPGSLGTTTVADITAYLLSKNAFPSGAADLAKDAASQRGIAITEQKRGGQ